MIDFPMSYPNLFGGRWPAKGLAAGITRLDINALAAECASLRRNTPRRSRTGRAYFVGHSGMPPSRRHSNRLEEHMAMALLNLDRFWPLPRGGWLRFLDYQVPLKSARDSRAIGKIDLLGVSDKGRLVIVELKIVTKAGGRSDPPPAAFMEALRYAAIVQADQRAIRTEVKEQFGIEVALDPPMVVLLAPLAWWRAWNDTAAAGSWATPFANLLRAVYDETGISTECLALDRSLDDASPNGIPRLKAPPGLCPVTLDGSVTIGAALCLSRPDDLAVGRYSAHVLRALWRWANEHHVGQLDEKSGPGRPPVLAPDFAALNVLIDEANGAGVQIRAAIPVDRRHQHFASLRSSQALTQSLFGAIQVLKRFDLLEEVTADCGRPAFFENHRGWDMRFEQEVRTLGEKRPTSVDVMLTGPDQCVAVECKFTESEFGRCSRPRLTRDDPQFCDGGYHAQAGRTDRCALTAIGIKYWHHLPQLFAWPVDRDQLPCLFGQTYQLTRNALAGTFSCAGKAGHALIVYDANNPAFQAGGEAVRQWETALAACLIPGLLRRLSWQRLLTRIGQDAQLAPLAQRLAAKYGFDSLAATRP